MAHRRRFAARGNESSVAELNGDLMLNMRHYDGADLLRLRRAATDSRTS